MADDLEVITTYLEMKSPAELRPKLTTDTHFDIREMIPPSWRLNRSLYLAVGDAWAWKDKRDWSERQWQFYAEDDSLRTFISYYAETIAGYYELRRANEEIEIAYFGLMPEFIGRGLGGALLSDAIERAWSWEATRVWVHTCTLDHSAALQNYQARGLSIYRQTAESV